jgi:hypothetical protein
MIKKQANLMSEGDVKRFNDIKDQIRIEKSKIKKDAQAFGICRSYGKTF